ncbi:P-loop NTPase fold protein [Pseudonocardia sp. TRM90224]|uniref:P-loop NTPase fold protein n=1 Tax=Pseudonocardia sp. TRM90224 TaxID=2812678 RepID=UPI001E544E7F|nr:P-loop NTPase fold protein [Pseudonocardia sp. TRM90224]
MSAMDTTGPGLDDLDVLGRSGEVEFAVEQTARPWQLPIDTLVLSAGQTGGLGSLGATVRSAMPGLAWSDIRYADLTPDAPQVLGVTDGDRTKADTGLRALVIATVRPSTPTSDDKAQVSAESAARATAAAVDMALARGATALGLPLLGAGVAGLRPADVAAAVIPLVVGRARAASGLRRIVLICSDDLAERAIRSTLTQHLGERERRRLVLRPGAQELLDFTHAVTRARNATRATGQDVLLAALVRPGRTHLDPTELQRGASSALLRALPAGNVDRRLAKALGAANVDADQVMPPDRIPRDVDPEAPELTDVTTAAQRLATRLATRPASGSQQVWSHHIVAAALADQLSPAVRSALGPSRRTLRAALREAIAERWRDEDVRQLDEFWADADRAHPDEPRYTDVRSDADSTQDRIGITADVQAMAALLAATATQPPLSVALLGNWGSGKSTFMNLLQQRVTTLAEQARQDQSSPFSPLVRQVRFNAWHLSDDHVWVGMVEHLFHELRGQAQVPEQVVLPAGTSVSQLEADLKSAKDQQAALEQGLARIDELDADRGWWGWLQHGLRLIRVGKEVRAQATREFDFRKLLLPAAILAGIVVISILLAQLLDLPLLAWIVTAGSIGASIPTIVGRARDAAVKGRTRLADDKARLDTKVEELEAQLNQVDPARGLDALVTQLAATDRYASYRGLAGRIHQDLARLDRQMSAVDDPRMRQRIILYIDDLDRCASDRVMQVLQVINLLVSMRLFVVVVAVDPRWLITALEEHHASQMRARRGRALDYLDKIFHIAFAVRPMSDRAGNYLRTLLPVPEPDGDEGEPDQEPADTPAQESTRGTEAADGAGAAARVPDGPAPAGGRGQEARAGEEVLRIARAEAEFLPRIAGLLDTPRAVKKTVNLYLLFRATISDDELDLYLGDDRGGPFQAAALLIAATVSSPVEASDLLHRILRTDRFGSIRAALAAPTYSATLARGATPALPERLSAWIERLVTDFPAIDDPGPYRQCARTIARYSFESYALFDG